MPAASSVTASGTISLSSWIQVQTTAAKTHTVLEVLLCVPPNGCHNADG